MNMNNGVIRGILHLATKAPKIVAKCFGSLRPLTIESSDVEITGNTTIDGYTKLNGAFIGKNGIMYGTAEPGNVISNPQEGQVYFKIIS